MLPTFGQVLREARPDLITRPDLQAARADPASRWCGVPRDIIGIVEGYAFEPSDHLPVDTPAFRAQCETVDDLLVHESTTSRYEQIYKADYYLAVRVNKRQSVTFQKMSGTMNLILHVNGAYADGVEFGSAPRHIAYVGAGVFYVRIDKMLSVCIVDDSFVVNREGVPTLYRLGIYHLPLPCGLTLLCDNHGKYKLHDYSESATCHFREIMPLGTKEIPYVFAGELFPDGRSRPSYKWKLRPRVVHSGH